jgi:hypothetical protein
MIDNFTREEKYFIVFVGLKCCDKPVTKLEYAAKIKEVEEEYGNYRFETDEIIRDLIEIDCIQEIHDSRLVLTKKGNRVLSMLMQVYQFENLINQELESKPVIFKRVK